MKINKINNYKAIIMELLKSLNKALIKLIETHRVIKR